VILTGRLHPADVSPMHRVVCAAHPGLLDAAHIVPHADGGKAIVPNGLSMCKIHRAAFDANILGVRPDLVLEIREDILDEVDGPMLSLGLKEMHAEELLIRRRRELQPDPDSLGTRRLSRSAVGQIGCDELSPQTSGLRAGGRGVTPAMG